MITLSKSEENDRLIVEGHSNSLNGLILYGCKLIKPSELPSSEYRRMVKSQHKKAAKTRLQVKLAALFQEQIKCDKKEVERLVFHEMNQWLNSEIDFNNFFEAFGLEKPAYIEEILNKVRGSFPNDLVFEE